MATGVAGCVDCSGWVMTHMVVSNLNRLQSCFLLLLLLVLWLTHLLPPSLLSPLLVPFSVYAVLCCVILIVTNTTTNHHHPVHRLRARPVTQTTTWSSCRHHPAAPPYRRSRSRPPASPATPTAAATPAAQTSLTPASGGRAQQGRLKGRAATPQASRTATQGPHTPMAAAVRGLIQRNPCTGWHMSLGFAIVAHCLLGCAYTIHIV